MTGRTLTRRTAVLVSALTTLGLASGAQASTISSSGGVLTIAAAANETNLIVVTRLADDANGKQVIQVDDSNPASTPSDSPIQAVGHAMFPPSGNCRQPNLSVPRVICTDTAFTQITATLGDKNDYFSAGAGSLALPKIDVSGDAGDDYLKGAGGADTVRGGSGDDQLFGFANNDTLVPGTGADDVWGNDGSHSAGNVAVPDAATSDRVTFSDRTKDQPVFVSLDDQANDGEAGQKDNVHTDVEDITGGNGNDTLIGSALTNDIYGQGGSDTLRGLGGDDNLFANNTDLTAGDGSNVLDGGAGDDHITGAAGVDTVSGGDGIDVVQAGAGENDVSGGAGDDKLTTGDAKDVVDGGAGNDVIAAGAGQNQVLTGGDGDDTIDSGDGKDTVSAGAGIDTVTAGGGDNVIALGDGDDHSTTTDGKDTVTGGAGDDVIAAGNGDNDLRGEAGTDQLTSGTGADAVNGGDGDDVIKSGAGDDTITGGLGADDIDAAEGIDTVSYAEKTEPVYAAIGGALSGTWCGDVRTAESPACEGDKVVAAENLIGGSAGDHLIGDDAANVLNGGGGDDTLEGKGSGDDIIGGTGNDAVSYREAPAGVGVTLDDVRNDGVNCPGDSCENDNLHADIESVEGSTHDDVLIGSDGANTLSGLAGNDILDGLKGADVIDGGADRDHVLYATRTQAVNVSLDGVANDGEAGEGDNVSGLTEDISTGAGNDTVVANELGNVIDTGAGDDSVDGGRGADDIHGEDGRDTVVYGGRSTDETVSVQLDNEADDGAPGEGDNIHLDVENLTGGAEADTFEGSTLENVLTGGAGNDEIRAAQSSDKVYGGAGDDYLDGGAGDDVIQPGTGADTVIGGAGQADAVDYSERTVAVTVTTDDNLANDGEAGEGDNVDPTTELVNGPTIAAPAPAPAPAPEDGKDDDGATDEKPAQQAAPVAGGDGDGGTQTVAGSSGTKAETVNTTTVAKQSSATFASATAKGRQVMVRGKILVKARNGLAQSATACKGGGKVLVTIRKGSKVVGKKLVSITRTCAFSAPVTLAAGTTGKLKVEVRFLGNAALKASKRSSKLQVNG
ncbi:MAG: hypothetical protein ACJ762_14410 [Solirubrobacteraceae bacterium]